MRTISNTDNVIDSRDVIKRIEELQDEQTNWDDEGSWAEENEDDAAELSALLALQEEAEGYSEDWKHGSTLIHRDYFVKYCEELVKDIGDLPNEIPSYIEIDWIATAGNLEQNYTSVDFGGKEYLIR
jgi:hypothetical protein